MAHALESDNNSYPAKSSISADDTCLEDDLVVVADNDLTTPGRASSKLDELCTEEYIEGGNQIKTEVQ